MKKYIKINTIDNVMVALTDLAKGEIIPVGGQEISLLEDIKRGHKFALQEIKEGEDIIKYGAPIGHATKAIVPGEWIHSHNTKPTCLVSANIPFIKA